nr:type I inositol polyphosphate 5-phosphatase 4-like isoform X1 [Tanacetum cinerariifolium]
MIIETMRYTQSTTIAVFFKWKIGCILHHLLTFTFLDNGPAKKWVALIRRTLDNLLGTSDDSNLEFDSDFEESTEKNQSFSNRPSIQSLSHNMRINNNNMGTRQPRLERRYSDSDRVVVSNQFNGYDMGLGYNGSDVSPDSRVNLEMMFGI